MRQAEDQKFHNIYTIQGSKSTSYYLAIERAIAFTDLTATTLTEKAITSSHLLEKL